MTERIVKGKVTHKDIIGDNKYIIIEEYETATEITFDLDTEIKDDILDQYEVGDDIILVFSDKPIDVQKRNKESKGDKE